MLMRVKDFERTLEDNKKLTEIDSPSDLSKNSEEYSEDAVVHNVEENNSTSMIVKEGPVDNSTKTRLACNNSISVDVEDSSVASTVQLLNGSFYQISLAEEFNSSVTNRSQPATCSLTLFFASWCDFSAAAAPHYNALARVFPQIKMYAVDSSLYHSLNTQYGVMAVPTLLVFHNSRPLYKYNYTEYTLASFTQFVSLLTGLEPQNITEPDILDWEGNYVKSSLWLHGQSGSYLVAVVLLYPFIHF